MRLRTERGFTLVEALIAVAISALLLAGLAGVLSQAFAAREATAARNDVVQQARFAMDRMLDAVAATDRLMVPQADDPGTAWDESVRPVLVVALDPRLDRDGDGDADADNDGDGRVDEDPPEDLSFDDCPGLCGIDDNGDGLPEGNDRKDDDDDGAADEDPINGLDDDGDGSIDEDPDADLNDDGKPGVRDVDDDGDSLVDEGGSKDDDEDGVEDEDWVDAVAFYLQGGTLIERTPLPWDENGDLVIDGNDWREAPLATGVTSLNVERIVDGAARAVLVRITLELAGDEGEDVQLEAARRLGSRP